jgi:hypothetical protein
VVGAVLNDLAQRDLSPGDVLSDVLENIDVRLMEADPVASEMNMALRVASLWMSGNPDEEMRALQVVWPDRENRFPDEGWGIEDSEQPLYPK